MGDDPTSRDWSQMVSNDCTPVFDFSKDCFKILLMNSDSLVKSQKVRNLAQFYWG